MDFKELLRKNLLTVLSGIAIISMFLTFASFSAETEYADTASSITGFQACEYSIFGYLLFLGPVSLIAMNYIKPLEKFKGILSIAVPCTCLLLLIITFFHAKAGYQAVGGASADVASSFGVEFEYSTSIGLGTIIMAVSYIAMIVFGIKTQHDFSIGKFNVGNIKNAGTEFMKNAQQGIAKATQNLSAGNSSPVGDNPPAGNNSFAGGRSSMGNNSSSTASKKHIDEVLSLIERLAKMRDDGVLSEEEFSEKKKKFLEEI